MATSDSYYTFPTGEKYNLVVLQSSVIPSIVTAATVSNTDIGLHKFDVMIPGQFTIQ